MSLLAIGPPKCSIFCKYYLFRDNALRDFGPNDISWLQKGIPSGFLLPVSLNPQVKKTTSCLYGKENPVQVTHQLVLHVCFGFFEGGNLYAQLGAQTNTPISRVTCSTD